MSNFAAIREEFLSKRVELTDDSPGDDLEREGFLNQVQQAFTTLSEAQTNLDTLLRDESFRCWLEAKIRENTYRLYSLARLQGCKCSARITIGPDLKLRITPFDTNEETQEAWPMGTQFVPYLVKEEKVREFTDSVREETEILNQPDQLFYRLLEETEG